MADPNPENVQDLLARAHGIINESEPKTEAAIRADERERLAKLAEGMPPIPLGYHTDERTKATKLMLAHGKPIADWIRSQD